MTLPFVSPIPLLPGPWRPLSEAEATIFRQRVPNVMHNGGEASSPLARMTDLRVLALSFYPGWFVVEGEIAVAAGQQGTCDVLYGPGMFWVIDGHSIVIHDLNAGRIPRSLTHYRPGLHTGDSPAVHALYLPSPLAELDADTSGPDYLRFFCASVWGQEGPFMLVESIDSPLLAGLDAAQQPWADDIQPLTMTRDDKGLVGEGVVAYGNGLFAARFRLDGGMVVMEDDRPFSDVAIPAQQFAAPLRHLRPLVESTDESSSP